MLKVKHPFYVRRRQLHRLPLTSKVATTTTTTMTTTTTTTTTTAAAAAAAAATTTTSTHATPSTNLMSTIRHDNDKNLHDSQIKGHFQKMNFIFNFSFILLKFISVDRLTETTEQRRRIKTSQKLMPEVLDELIWKQPLSVRS